MGVGIAGADQARCGAGGHGSLLETMDQPLQVPRRVVRCSEALAYHAEGPDLRADRWHCGRADDVASRMLGRHTQLGLSLLLAERCDAYLDGVDECRLLRRGELLARMALARCLGKAKRTSDHVRSCRRTPAYGMGAELASGL